MHTFIALLAFPVAALLHRLRGGLFYEAQMAMWRCIWFKLPGNIIYYFATIMTLLAWAATGRPLVAAGVAASAILYRIVPQHRWWMCGAPPSGRTVHEGKPYELACERVCDAVTRNTDTSDFILFACKQLVVAAPLVLALGLKAVIVWLPMSVMIPCAYYFAQRLAPDRQWLAELASGALMWGPVVAVAAVR